MGIGTSFGAFTTARLGIYASQKALSVVGNNIANINTEGYTRQSLSQKSMNLGGADKYSSRYAVRVGTGALVTGVNQLRDPYLDIRYRNEQASMGYMAAKLEGLNHISTYLDEVGKGEEDEGVLEAQFNDLISQIEQLSAAQGVGRDSADTLVRSAANSLTVTLRSYANKLDTLMKEQEDGFKQDLENVNIILKNIRELNSSIRKSQIYGSDSLEQKDERNNLIDELSQYIRINVSYEQEDIGTGNTVEKLVIKLAGDDASNTPEAIRSNSAVLVDGNYAAKLSIQKVPKKNEDGDFVNDKGQVVEKEEEAAKVQDPYFRLSVGPLKDKYERVMVLDGKIENMGEYPFEAKAQADGKQKELEEANTNPNVSYRVSPTKLEDGTIEYQVVEKTKETVNDGGTPPQDIEFSSREDAEAKIEELKRDGSDASYEVVEDTTNGTFTILKTTERVPDGCTFPDETATAKAQADGKQKELEEANTNPNVSYRVSPTKLEDGRIGYQIVETTVSTVQKPDGTAEVFDSREDALKRAGELAEGKKDATDAVYKYEFVEGTDPADPNKKTYTIQETKKEMVQSFPMERVAGEAEAYARDYIATLPTKAKDADENTLEYIYSLSPRKNEEGVIVGYDMIKTTNTLSSAQKLTDNTLYGSLQAKRELLTEQGEYATPEQIGMDNNAPSKRGIPYYRKSLDTLANKLASVLNEANTIPDDVLGEGGYEGYKGGPLFSNSGSGDVTTGITAANISVSKSWADGLTRIVHSKAKNPTSTDNTNSLHILNLMLSSGHEFTPDAFDLDTGSATAGEAYFKGSFQEFFTDQIGGTLANDRMSTQTMYQNFSTVVDELYVDRDAVSGVDLNDEAMNLMQFQKSYTAACRLMTTVDELLDKLINGTGRAGL